MNCDSFVLILVVVDNGLVHLDQAATWLGNHQS